MYISIQHDDPIPHGRTLFLRRPYWDGHKGRGRGVSPPPLVPPHLLLSHSPPLTPPLLSMLLIQCHSGVHTLWHLKENRVHCKHPQNITFLGVQAKRIANSAGSTFHVPKIQLFLQENIPVPNFSCEMLENNFCAKHHVFNCTGVGLYAF